MSDIQALTQHQRRCLENLPEGHEIISCDEEPPIVSAPNGALLMVEPNGRMVAAVEGVRSYLYVYG